MKPVPPSRTAYVLVALCLLAGVLLRLQAARGDLWYDELWSLEHASRAEELSDLFLDPELQHDNNHWINTAWMRALGPTASALEYRALALLGGSLTLLLLAWAGFRRGRVAGVVASLAGAGSWLLVLYSSEARGYGTVCAFALAAFLVVEDARRRPGPAGFLPFWLLSLGGTLSHLSYLYVHLALTAWTLTRLRGTSSAVWLRRLLAWHLVPGLFLALLYSQVLRHVVIGGGPGYDSILSVAESAVANVFGLHGSEAIARPLVLLTLAGALVQILVLAARREDRAIFHLFALFLAPALFLALRPPEVLYVRYFLVCIPFLLLCLAELCQELWAKAATARAVVAVFLLALLGGNGLRLAEFLERGRGAGSATLDHLLEHTPEASIEIGIDGQHNAQLLAHHAERAGVLSRLRLIDPRGGPVRRAPRWVLTHSLEDDFEPREELAVFGTRYRLEYRQLGPGLSGWSWFLYQDVRRSR